VRLDRGFIIPLSEKEVEKSELSSYASYTQSLVERQERIMKKAQEVLYQTNVERAQKKPKGVITQYEIGSLVMLRYPLGMGNKRQKPNKLVANLKGPYSVINVEGPRYTIQCVSDPKDIVTTHIENLEIFLEDEHYSLQEIRNKDEQKEEVERIIRANNLAKPQKETWGFAVKFKGKPLIDAKLKDKRDWYLWKDLRNNAKLHEFLREKEKREHIPEEYLTEDDKRILLLNKSKSKKGKRTSEVSKVKNNKRTREEAIEREEHEEDEEEDRGSGKKRKAQLEVVRENNFSEGGNKEGGTSKRTRRIPNKFK